MIDFTDGRFSPYICEIADACWGKKVFGNIYGEIRKNITEKIEFLCTK